MSAFIKNCEFCQKAFETTYKLRNIRRFCSVSCAVSSRTSYTEIECALCGKKRMARTAKMKSKSGLYFCSKECKNKAQRSEKNIIPAKHYSGTGLRSYIQIARRNYEPICVSCGYKEDSRLLDIDHIDSNRKNNDLSNLQVLCVMCHAKKTRVNWPQTW